LHKSVRCLVALVFVLGGLLLTGAPVHAEEPASSQSVVGQVALPAVASCSATLFYGFDRAPTIPQTFVRGTAVMVVNCPSTRQVITATATIVPIGGVDAAPTPPGLGFCTNCSGTSADTQITALTPATGCFVAAGTYTVVQDVPPVGAAAQPFCL
jgi:hypothetical protein